MTIQLSNCSGEHGLFNDEGLVEGGFASAGEATAALLERYVAADELRVAPCCSEHPEHEAESCEECNREEP